MSTRRIALIVATLLANSVMVFASASAADLLPEHTILRAAGPITIDGVIDEPSWGAAASVGDFHFPWWQEGDKEQTQARLLWDDDNLYISFVADDRHISAIHKERDAPVSQDDCVEAFIMPDTTHVGHYYNFEVNVIGTIDTAPNIPPKPGDTWRMNLYRIGGKVNPQYSQWSNTGTPKPKYHVPERFGIMHFSANVVDVKAVAAPAGIQDPETK